MSKDKANQKGITLIALVITIIVMLILVGVTVTVALNGGLFSTAQKAVGDTESERDDELALSDEKVEINGEWYNSIDEYLEGSGITMLEGNGQTYYTLAPTTLSFRSSADINDFQEVQINGETIDQSNYTMTEGSTIINLSIDYLKTLEEDDYIISIVSKTGSASAGFSVVEPEVNSDGFYYNQPYTGYVSSYDQTWAFFFRENGTMDTIIVDNGYTTEYSYVVDGNNLTVTGELLGTLTGSVSEAGVYCNELGVTFTLGDESIVADEGFIYIYDSSLGGYVVQCIDKTKASYGAIRTGVNGKPTVKLADNMFVDIYVGSDAGNPNLIIAPTIPNTVTSIGDSAFRSCTSLTGVTIPNSVTSIDNSAFMGCTSLESITFEGTVEQWGTISIGGWNALGNVTKVVCTDGTVSLN